MDHGTAQVTIKIIQLIKQEKLTPLQSLQKKRISPQKAILIEKERQYILKTDACDRQTGSTLSQKHDENVAKLIGYWSNMLSD